MARNRRAVKSDAPLAPRNRPMFRRLFDRNKSDGPAILGTEPRATVGLRVTYVQCANVRDLHPGEIKPVRVRGGHELALAIIDGRVHAFEAYCPHQAWPLKWSEAETGADGTPNLICGLHGWRFCLDTGVTIDPPSMDDLGVYPTRVTDGVVYVGLPGVM
ncbi:MAG: Rieske (2Fe-2S) protein [Proteobacteria bacterium]|nr:Rieske (2Fe-2S) protein [Pseudomonadota bacterium]NCV22870.1 Rieske (2Fe-2S) protein [Chloroflexota bacterium]NBQ33114.1 Rieske (2Fe-2S) protein [Pseudomonadota bacterium]NBQ63075.1 Rieske (2Fe-2S) protein [Pseudomonadota bacterium]NBT04503.1 Rieske (2Fe-2S) protein [Pseudomonadota bacterium]